MRAGAAIEVLHTYSLVHDDLPCMDDDVLRRGKPTTHVQFDEATAVLAGDGLLTFAFEILADPATHASPAVRCQLIAGLARAAGSEGMVGGQMMDMLAPDKSFDSQAVMELQRMKTGALFEFACEAGPVLGEAGRSPRHPQALCPGFRPYLPEHRRSERHGQQRRGGGKVGRQGRGPGKGDPGVNIRGRWGAGQGRRARRARGLASGWLRAGGGFAAGAAPPPPGSGPLAPPAPGAALGLAEALNLARHEHTWVGLSRA